MSCFFAASGTDPLAGPSQVAAIRGPIKRRLLCVELLASLRRHFDVSVDGSSWAVRSDVSGVAGRLWELGEAALVTTSHK